MSVTKLLFNLFEKHRKPKKMPEIPMKCIFCGSTVGTTLYVPMGVICGVCVKDTEKMKARSKEVEEMYDQIRSSMYNKINGRPIIRRGYGHGKEGRSK